MSCHVNSNIDENPLNVPLMKSSRLETKLRVYEIRALNECQFSLFNIPLYMNIAL